MKNTKGIDIVKLDLSAFKPPFPISVLQSLLIFRFDNIPEITGMQ